MYSLQMNYRDPRFWRAMQQEQASRPNALLPTRGAATSNFVNNQMGFLGAMDKLGLQKRIFEDDLAYKNKVLQFEKHKANVGLRMGKNDLEHAKQNMYGQLGIGGLTSIWSAYEGRRQRLALEKQAQDMAVYQQNQNALMKQVLERMKVTGGI